MFTVIDRQKVRDRVLALAASDSRVVAGAVVGSLAFDEGDRWSDLDLTFGVADGSPIAAVLDDWTGIVSTEFSAVHLFDLPHGSSLYRVFLLPGCLQFDLSFTPASDFGALGPKFRLLFGRAVERPAPALQPPAEVVGYALHHAVRARVCIERGRYWQAEYWISAVRDYALSLACRARGLPAHYARGVDALPDDVRTAFSGALVRELSRADLLRALEIAVAGLLRESKGVHQAERQIERLMQELVGRDRQL